MGPFSNPLMSKSSDETEWLVESMMMMVNDLCDLMERLGRQLYDPEFATDTKSQLGAALKIECGIYILAITLID
jgi:hypothetical protein